MLEAFAWGLWAVGGLVAFLLGVLVALVAIFGLSVGIYGLVVEASQIIAGRREARES